MKGQTERTVTLTDDDIKLLCCLLEQEYERGDLGCLNVIDKLSDCETKKDKQIEFKDPEAEEGERYIFNSWKECAENLAVYWLQGEIEVLEE